MLRIAVCDDIPFYQDILAKYIGDWAVFNGVRVEIEKYRSGEEVLLGIEKAGDFTAVFMDVELGGMDGIETALKIQEQSVSVSFVFVTGHEEYFRRMFDVHHVHHISKPVPRLKVFDTLDKIMEDQRNFFESFVVKYDRKTVSIPLGEVFYFESEKRRIRSFLERGRQYVFYQSMNMLEEELNTSNYYFIRTHQSYLVNTRQIEMFYPRRLVMRNGDDIPISRDRKELVEEACKGVLRNKKLHAGMLFVT